VELCQIDLISPIDIVLKKIKPLILPVFVKKWSQHVHTKPLKSKCNLGWVGDGNWKLGRPKCIYTGLETNVRTKEFVSVELGCRESPEKGSYYCKIHKHYELKFKYYSFEISINPATIEKARTSI
jgi:hypothetical protein